MEKDGSILESETCPQFQCLEAGQKVDVFLLENARQFLWRDSLDWLDSLPAYMLYRVGRDA
jgi:hypothetical protein